MRRLCAGIILLWGLSGGAVADEISPGGIMKLDPNYAGYCIENAEFTFGGVHIDMPQAAVITALGQPIGREPRPAASDGFYDERLVYDGLVVDIRRGEVVEFAATDRRWQSPSGLRPAMTRQQLFDVLGAEPSEHFVHRDETLYDVYFCNGGIPADLGWLLRFYVNGNGVLREIAVLQDWP